MAVSVVDHGRDWRRMTRTIAHYKKIEQIGEGTYGQVYRAECLDTGRIVALKKIHVHHGGYWGMPPTVIREIKILKRLQHENLIQMYEVVSSKGVEHLEEDDVAPSKSKNSSERIIDAREGYKGNLYLVLEYMSHDLTGLMDVAYRFNPVQVKCIFRQLLQALEYMHSQKYMHRDIKSSNILIDSYFRVKLADFGLARSFEPPILDNIHDRGTTQEFTNKVITLWYRPPEILLGATRYGPAVDIWSAGCILAELILSRPLLPGKTEMEELNLIFELLGTPNADSWDGFMDLKLMRTGEVVIEKERKKKLRDKYGHKMVPVAMNLLEKLLEMDPAKRPTASRALSSRYFMQEPRAPDRPEDLGLLQLGEGGGHFHEFQTKKKRREAKAVAKKASSDARARGMTEKQADAEYDAVYRECMKKVAEEGNSALITEEDKEKLEKEKAKRKTDQEDRMIRDEDILTHLADDGPKEKTESQREDAGEARARKKRHVDDKNGKERRGNIDRKDRSERDRKERSDRKRHRSLEERESRHSDRKEEKRRRREERSSRHGETAKDDTDKRDRQEKSPSEKETPLGEAGRPSFSPEVETKSQEEEDAAWRLAERERPPETWQSSQDASRREASRERRSSRGNSHERRSSRDRRGDSRDRRGDSRERRSSRGDSRERRHRHKSSRRDRDSSRQRHRDKDRHRKSSRDRGHRADREAGRPIEEGRDRGDPGRMGGDRYGPPRDGPWRGEAPRDGPRGGDWNAPPDADMRPPGRNDWNGPPRGGPPRPMDRDIDRRGDRNRPPPGPMGRGPSPMGRGPSPMGRGRRDDWRGPDDSRRGGPPGPQDPYGPPPPGRGPPPAPRGGDRDWRREMDRPGSRDMNRNRPRR